MNDDMNRTDGNEKEPVTPSVPEEPVSGPTPEEEAAKAIEEARQTEAERLEAERRQKEAEWEANFRRAEEERRREQEERAEAIRRENEAREEAEKAAKAERKVRKKKGLRLTAAVLAVALLVGAAGYAAGGIAKTIQDLRAEVSSLKESQDRLVDGSTAAQPSSEIPGRSGNEDHSRPGSRIETADASSDVPTSSEETYSADPVIGTAEAVKGKITGLTDVSDIVEQVLPSVVSIVITQTVSYPSYWGGDRKYEEKGAGSGIIIGDDGTELWIVTNHHVIEDADTIEITFCDEKSVSAYVKGTDKDNDLAVVGVKLADLEKSTINSIKIITIGDSDDLKLGQGVIAIGNALGWGQSVTTGVVSAFNREVEFEDGTKMYLMQTSAAINPGNSGGALVDINGNVIGINSSKIGGSTVEGMGFAIPISRAIPIIEKLMSRETLSKVSEEEQGTIGISGATVTSSVSKAYNMPVGVYVAKIIEGGGAANSDLHEGDIITALNDQEITSMEDLQKLLQYYKAGTEVALTVQRQDGNGSYAEATIMVTLGTRESIQSAEDQQDSQEQESQGDGAPGQGGQDNGGFGQNGQIEPDPNEGQQQGQEFYNPFEQFGFPFGN